MIAHTTTAINRLEDESLKARDFFLGDFELWVSVNFSFQSLYVCAFRDVRVVFTIRGLSANWTLRVT